MVTCFKDLKVGDCARVVRFNGLDRLYRNRLMSLGLTPGTEFQVQHVAPLGDPIDIRVRGFYLSLRRQEAGAMEVELVDATDTKNQTSEVQRS
ncbi:MAG: ferrous iron transport protein A [Porticoccaceae bacterium]|jgi:ferrous iron transport protein A